MDELKLVPLGKTAVAREYNRSRSITIPKASVIGDGDVAKAFHLLDKEGKIIGLALIKVDEEGDES